MLADEGYIVAKQRSGYFVNSLDLPYTGTPTDVHDEIHYIPEEITAVSDTFEYSLWFKTIRRVISDYGE